MNKEQEILLLDELLSEGFDKEYAENIIEAMKEQ